MNCNQNSISVHVCLLQDSAMGPLLFFIYINDIDNGIVNKVLKLADDTKLYRQVGTAEDIAKLKNDLEKLAGWSK
jgi:ribonuclease P/MRP protein subunit RPP40